MSTANKLTYLNGTKQAIKQAINEDFEVIDNNTTFREYADEISSNNAKYKDLIPKETKNATNTLDISNSSGLDKALVTLYGNTYQDGTPTPDTPIPVQVVSGDNSITIANNNNTQSQTYPINIGNIELCKTGKYKDRIYKDSGKWYLEKQIGKVTFSAITTGTFDTSGTYKFFKCGAPRETNGVYAGINVYCKYLIGAYNLADMKSKAKYNNSIYWGSGSCFIRVDDFETTEEYIDFINNHEIEVYARLRTPTTTEITENNYPTLYNQLNNIKLFEGVNHITMTNESGLDVEFDITYYKDWKLD